MGEVGDRLCVLGAKGAKEHGEICIVCGAGYGFVAHLHEEGRSGGVGAAAAEALACDAFGYVGSYVAGACETDACGVGGEGEVAHIGIEGVGLAGYDEELADGFFADGDEVL